MRALSLDYLRVILCLLVIDYHYAKIFQGGHLAVIGFFVLAGYFLEKEFERTDSLNLTRFFKKKASRLLPEYLFVTIPVAAIVILFPSIYPVDFTEVEKNAFALFKFLETTNNPSWFLTCLFAFIAIAPILFCLQQTKWGLPLLFLLSLSYGMILYAVYRGEQWLYVSAQINVTYFLGGMLACRMWRTEGMTPWKRMLLAALCIAGLIELLMTPLMLRTYWPFNLRSLAICGLFMLLIPVLYTPVTSVSRFQRPVVWLSSLTYAMYLFHAPIKRAGICILTRLTGYNQQELLTPATYFLFFMLTIAAAALFQPIKKRILERCAR